MDRVVLAIPMPPSVNACWREATIEGRPRRVRTGDYRRWLKLAGAILMAHRPPRLTGDVEVLIQIGPRNRGADIDNRTKPTLDLLVAQRVIADDRHVVRVTTEWDENWSGEPGARVTVTTCGARAAHVTRAPADGLKFASPFGSMFAHVARAAGGAIVGVQISHQLKDPESRVSELIRAINAAMREICEGNAP